MAKKPTGVILAGIGMVIAHPTKLRFPKEGDVRVHLRSAALAMQRGSSKVTRSHVVIEKLPCGESPLDLGANAVRISSRRGTSEVVVPYSQFVNLFNEL